MMRSDRMTIKAGETPPTYEEILMSRGGAGQSTRHYQSSMPWWNPRYWRKRVWAGIAVVIVVIIIIAVAVSVSKAKNNAYPTYAAVTYSLSDTFQGDSFFDNFNYFEGQDPSQGFVHYVPQIRAQQLNLTGTSADSAFLKVDTSVTPETVPNASTGRFSVRVESKKTYNDGLFIFDVRHTPYGCGTWPALWLTDPSNWPHHGEIDIMEAVNQATDGNQMTLHTSDGCSMDVKRKEHGDTLQTTCNSAKHGNAGCGVQSSDDSFGESLNDKGGAVMAVEWRSAGIRMWQFARDSIPADITSKKPAPDTWGTANADFPGTNCDIGSHFKNNSIVINIDLCGSLTTAHWGKSKCPSNCTDLVANQPQAFTNAFWEFGAFEVYTAA